MNLPKGIRYSYLVFSNLISSKSSGFNRILEPSSITDGENFVKDYNRADKSVMMLPYALALDTILRINGHEISRIVDLCCGPGHFTRLLAKKIKVQDVTGVDLSNPMLRFAAENAEREKITHKMNFVNSDARHLTDIESETADLTTFLNGAHHFQTIDDVNKVIQEAERITKKDGTILILDPVRQKNKKLSDLYFKLSGEDYERKGMQFFLEDFKNSLLASFRPDEFINAIPGNSARNWYMIIPFGVPSFQILIGVHSSRKNLFIHPGLTNSTIKEIIPRESILDWKMFNFSFRFGKIKRIKEGH